MAESTVSLSKADANTLRAACGLIDSMLADIKRDYAQLEDEHFKLATNYKILSDQAKFTRPTEETPSADRSYTEDCVDLDLVASQAAQVELQDSDFTVKDLIHSIVN